MKSKTDIQLINSLTKEQRNRILQFDGDLDNTCSLFEFLTTNLLDPNVTHIDFGHAKEVIDLKIGQEIYLPYGFGTKVKRIS